ncbi:dihydropteroate synthase [Agrococcus sp. HG114]|uniref:dihydropteroate synthase n=1 Tax=Agrococcus sp. HG114 TaxID=2969757 RepID=UPI00215AEF39|nr:dihydropteroate synthase [Agrococcus sp. HG114]MCR8670056.1 dihydropteroate synthase [Agrococcus sp. HG114]
MTEVWGILNVTPDSFSDGGRYVDPGAAIAHARRMRAQGADVIDIGGESTRPGAEPLDPAEERERILPVVSALVREGIRVSVDTIHASTASAVVAAGAEIVNDVTAGEHDPAMLRAVAESGARIVLMHSRGIDVTHDTHYDDVVAEVVQHLEERVAAAVAAGIARERIIVDPGYGFSKEPDDNWRLLAGLPSVQRLGFPVLVGTSRKRFLGTLLPEGADAAERDAATAATSLLAAQAGAAAVRVHDVASTVSALRVLGATAHAARSRSDRADGRSPDVGTGAVPSAPGLHGSIELTGIRARGFHGVLPEERRDGQEFVVDAALSLDLAAAVASDDVAQTVHYGELAEAIVAAVERDPVDLIETLADRIARACLADPRVEHASVTVHKPAAPIAVPFGDVAVRVHRGREPR